MSTNDSTKPPYWFPVKRFGWGWGLPVCWQGWAVLIGYFAVLVPASGWIKLQWGQPTATGFILVWSALLIGIVVAKGERPGSRPGS